MAVMPIPDDWNGQDWQCWSVEWPDSVAWNAILRGFITTPTKGRFWDERTGSVTDAQAIGVEIWNRNSPMEESLMPCNEDTIALFTRMAEALEALAVKPCCPTAATGGAGGGSRGAGISEEEPDPYEETVLEEPPEGFDTWASYRTHKCNMASDIVKNFKVDLLSISNLMPELSGAVWTAIVTGIVAVLLTPVPFDDIAVLVGLLTVAAFEYSFLASLSSEVQSNAQSLICVLYNSANSEDAKSNFQAEINALVDGLGLGLEAGQWVKDVAESLITNDVMNKLFTAGPTEEQSADCSSCGGLALAGMSEFNGCSGTVVSGDFSEGVDTEIDSCVSMVFGSDRANFVVVTTTTGVERHFEVISVSGNNGGMILNWSSGTGPEPQEDWPQLDDILGLTWDAVSMHFIRNTGVDDTVPFTITLRVTELP